MSLTREEYAALLADLDASGYRLGPPPPAGFPGLIDGPYLDAEVAEDTPCSACGGCCRYEARHLARNGLYESYRAFAVCTVCGAAEEF